MVYGPGDPLHRLRPLIAHMDAGDDELVIPESVAQWRGPRGFVKNVAHAVALAATHTAAVGRIYNVGEPQNFSEAEWAQRIADVVGGRGRITVKGTSTLRSILGLPATSSSTGVPRRGASGASSITANWSTSTMQSGRRSNGNVRWHRSTRSVRNNLARGSRRSVQTGRSPHVV